MARPFEQDKYSQHAAAYQYCPNGSERCSYCSMFKPASSCTKVSGVIDRNGWCQWYTPKTNPLEPRNIRLRA